MDKIDLSKISEDTDRIIRNIYTSIGNFELWVENIQLFNELHKELQKLWEIRCQIYLESIKSE